jgi:transaldolase/glucose-6-phosphate isomerase
MSRIKQLLQFGQSAWIDFISRGLLAGGGLRRLIEEDGVRGLTSNPVIFEKAIAGGAEYRDALHEAASGGERDPERIYERLAFEDIRVAADQMAGIYGETDGRDGFVSLEVSPRHAHDTAATVGEARRIWRAVARPNLMVKVPATAAGLPAIEALIADGINVNVTLLFSVSLYEQVARAYQRGLERRAAGGVDVSQVASVASFFVSRIDTLVDALLEERAEAAGGARRQRLLRLRGRAAVASAKLAHERYRALFSGAAWDVLAARGARVQRLLWASTGTKNPAYPDTLYVDGLIGPDTVNTLPPATLDAFRDHGRVEATLELNLGAECKVIQAIEEAGVPLGPVSGRLLDEGVRLFAEAYDRLLAAVSRAREAA